MLTFPKSHHLRRGSDFQAAYRRKQRAGDDLLLLYATPNKLPHPRLGLSVSRKHGGAVRRNRIKRLIREAFRLRQNDLPGGYDFVVIPRERADLTVERVGNSLVKLATKLARRHDERTPKRSSERSERDAPDDC